jgi:hypothetical protein
MVFVYAYSNGIEKMDLEGKIFPIFFARKPCCGFSGAKVIQSRPPMVTVGPKYGFLHRKRGRLTCLRTTQMEIEHIFLAHFRVKIGEIGPNDTKNGPEGALEPSKWDKVFNRGSDQVPFHPGTPKTSKNGPCSHQACF